MGSYRDIGIADAPFVAGVDLTQKPGFAVAPGSVNGEVIVAVGPSGNPWPWGIVTNTPSSGQEARVRVYGYAKAVCRSNACSLRYGAFLICGSDGALEPALTEGNGTNALPLSTSQMFARYMDDGTFATGSAYAEVFIMPIPLSTCGILSAS